MSLGDKLSIFSDKAFRKENGKIFEAIGNVVIISQKDTLYGEVATFNRETMDFKVEGNVRFISEGMTLHGSELSYNTNTGMMVIEDARFSQLEFNVIAKKIIRVDEKRYNAYEAELSTCKDCPESWSIYGKEIFIQLGSYAKIKNGLLKIKEVNILYIPYIVLPIQTKRKSGLLFPRISNKLGEGLSYEQPIFWAINDSQDATFSPTFWATRGYGTDLEYRHRFDYQKWLTFHTRLLNDTIYEPGKTNQSESGENYFRHFTDVENHQLWNPNLLHHFRFTGARDLDIVSDYQQYIQPKMISSDFGFDGFVDYRKDLFSLTLQSEYTRNQLFDDPLEWDKDYVQTMPKVKFSQTPLSLIQSSYPFLQHISLYQDVSFARFRQISPNEEDVFIRNADRLSYNPSLNWQMLTFGPFSLKSNANWEYQKYHFRESGESSFEKNALMTRTEFSFSIDKIYGLAFKEKVQKTLLPLDDEKKDVISDGKLIGNVDDFEISLTQMEDLVSRHSFRHLQDYKFIHHYLANDNESGNQRFNNQIQGSAGWFDYNDSIRRNEFRAGGNATRVVIPPENTIEFQWNNSLIKKSPTNDNMWMYDERYLKDNFQYQNIGHFNISQGYLISDRDEEKPFKDKLTRLLIETGYRAEKWHVQARDYYFHTNSAHIFELSFQRNFDYANFISSYNYNSFKESNLNFVSLGLQLRPTDTLGAAILRDISRGSEDLDTIYAFDYMPNNNCWIFNVNYRERGADKRYNFNVVFNFGDETFKNLKNNYFAARRFN